MSELKTPQQKEFGDITKAHLAAQPAQEYLKDDVGGHFCKVERVPVR